MTARPALRIPATFAIAFLLWWTCPPRAASQAGPVGLRQIVVDSEAGAQDIRARVLRGEAFEALARERSLDATAPQGGYLGRLAIADLRQEFQDALRDLEPGSVSLPVGIGGRYVLFEVMTEAESNWIELDRAAFGAVQQGRNEEAIGYFEAAIVQAEAAGFVDRLARSLNSLGNLYRATGEPAAAEPLYRRALAILESTRDPGHPDLAQSFNSLGLVLLAEARYAEAESAFQKALAIRENVFGPEAPEVATILSNLGDLRRAEGDSVGAGLLYTRSLGMLERTVGPDHPVTLGVLASLMGLSEDLVSGMLDRLAAIVGLAYFRDGAFEDQAREFGDLLALAPLDETSYVAMKDALLDSDLTELAEAVLRRGSERFPQSRLMRYHMAEVLAESGRNREALDLFVEAGEMAGPPDLDPTAEIRQHGFIYQRVGDMHTSLFEFDEALEAYTRALQIDPATPGGRIALGKMYFASNRLEEALEELNRAARIRGEETGVEPGLAEAVRLVDDLALDMALAEVNLALGNLAEAVSAAERALELDPSDPQAHYLRGRALIRLGDPEEGARELEEFARLNSLMEAEEQRYRDIEAIGSEATAAFLKGQPETAVGVLRQGIDRYPDEVGLHMSLGLALGRAGRYAEAIETFGEILDRGPGDDYLVHQNLAAAYEAVGDVEASERHQALYLERLEAELSPAVPE